ncbi:hypothetical protein EVAR_68816_1 [Eumeta japonica]|uniref:Uncharacterized protein n=1 Tax=Eumeta variegata TaxID=151549 RepID=A0A4C1Z317_EUMVA|nr:hypothetical protein EVAR_68816_1 [Eumeta japonica]
MCSEGYKNVVGVAAECTRGVVERGGFSVEVRREGRGVAGSCREGGVERKPAPSARMPGIDPACSVECPN